VPRAASASASEQHLTQQTLAPKLLTPRPPTQQQHGLRRTSSIESLRTGAEFAEVLKHRGARIGVSPSFELFAGPAVDTARLGLAFSRKSAKWAVARNVARRLTRESARAQADLPPRHYVVRGRGGLGKDWQKAKHDKSLTDLRQRWRAELDGLFRRVARPAAGGGALIGPT
jgi:ribonuclease P protein component